MGLGGTADGLASLTFLFTDIEDHTSLWDERPDAMSATLAAHDALVVRLVTESGGRVVKTAGDGAMAVFDSPAGAVSAAVALQRELAAADWPEVGPLRVRMGLHSGTAEERDGDYFGPDVIRAARLCAAAHGGQIVASGATAAAAAVAVAGVDWLDLGDHHLRGLTEPVPIRQAAAEGLPQDFPSLRTVDARPNTLPRFRTSFVGRDEEVATISRLLGSHRLVTLTGVGGSGKTRLAVEVAQARIGDHGDGIFFVDLAPIGEDGRIWDATADSLGLARATSMATSSPSEERVVRFLAGRDVLLIFDNCEHLLDEAADVVDTVLDASRSVSMLATSREGLSVEGERLVQVPSLPVDGDALRLFRDRAAAAGDPDPDPDAALEICRRLDGIPLAIELAAARCAQLGAAAVAAGLTDRFRMLTGSRRRIPRQRTLEATLDWSDDLLDPDQRHALHRLSVFAGSFSLDAAVAVTGSGPDELAALVAKSLVQRSHDDRFRLLETIRAYGQQRLVEAGAADDARRALAEWCVDRIGRSSDEHALGLERLDLHDDEEADVEAALEWAARRSDWSLVVRLGAPVALASLADIRPANRVAELLAAAADHDLDREERFLAVAGHAAAVRSGGPARPALFEEAASTAMNRTDVVAVVVLSWIANVNDALSRATGDRRRLARSVAMLERAEQIASELGHGAQAWPAVTRGIVLMNDGQWEAALEHLERAVTLGRVFAGGRGTTVRVTDWWTLGTVAAARFAAGRPVSRSELAALSITGADDAGVLEPFHRATLSDVDEADLAALRLDRADFERAAPEAQSTMIIGVGVLAARFGAWRVAARLLASVVTAEPVWSSPPGYALYRVVVPRIRDALPKPERDRLRAEGRALGLDGAFDLAAEWLGSFRREPS